jgi:hypothetical protein
LLVALELPSKVGLPCRSRRYMDVLFQKLVYTKRLQSITELLKTWTEGVQFFGT